MSQSITVASALIPIGTQTLGNILLVSNSFISYAATFDSSGIDGLSGTVAIFTVSISSDGTNFTDLNPVTIVGATMRSPQFSSVVSVDPPRTFVRLKATLQTFQPWTTAITITVN